MTDPETRAIPVDVVPDVAGLAAFVRVEIEELYERRCDHGRVESNRIDRCRDRGIEAATALETLAAENARLREAMVWISEHAARLRAGTDDWFEMVEFEHVARAALSPATQVKESGRG